MKSNRNILTRKEAIERGLIKPQSSDLLKKLQIILGIELALYDEYKKTNNEEYVYVKTKDLFVNLTHQDCVDILEAIKCAANPPN